MSRQITRDEVDWELASCRGIDTDLFYMLRADLIVEGLSYNHFRRMCFSCPIQVQCLKVGTKLERYGFWGGLSDDERNYLHEGRKGKTTERLHKDLEALLGFSEGMDKYAELKNIVVSTTREFGDYDRVYR